jgi:hypothetical protein
MPNTDWAADEIQKLAERAGKPLEVATAESFARKGWTARLGSYFAHGALDVARELDVLSERQSELPSGLPARVRALISCKAFPPDRSPIAYSVPKESSLSFTPGLLSSHRTQTAWKGNQQISGPIHEIEKEAAMQLLEYLKLDKADPLVAFDQFERIEIKKKGQPKLEVTYKRSPDGDRQLFTGIDSCVQAAIFWTQEDYQQHNPVYFAALNVPIFLLSVPFWDIPIGRGKPGTPRISTLGHQISLLPLREHAKGLMTLVATIEMLPKLIEALDNLLIWLVRECTALAG